MKRSKSKDKITVLKEFDGFQETATVVETVDRVVKRKCQRYYDFGRRAYQWNRVSKDLFCMYRGKEYRIFVLSRFGYCISIRGKK